MNKENHKKYMRKYRQENKEKTNEYMRKYRQENKEKTNEYNKKYYQKNKEKIHEKCRKYCQENKEKINERKRKHHQKTRLKILDHYCNDNISCQNCGIEDVRVLTLDHIYNNGNIHRKKIGTGMSIYLWIIKNNFPPIFQVLCYNCNWLKYHKTLTGVSA